MFMDDPKCSGRALNVSLLYPRKRLQAFQMKKEDHVQSAKRQMQPNWGSSIQNYKISILDE
ncbi:hypothetical protein LguiB_007074 [Lonicera macranthoides]